MIKNLLTRVFGLSKNEIAINELKAQNELLLAEMLKQNEINQSKLQEINEIAELRVQEVNDIAELKLQQATEVANKLRKDNNQPVCNTQGFEKEMATIDRNLECCVDIDYTENHAKDIRAFNLEKDDYNTLSDENKLAMKQELRDKLYENGIDEVVNTCAEYPTELLQSYLLSLMCTNNTYQTEFTNIDSYSRALIIDSIDEISFDNFKTAMKNKGFEVKAPSQAQIDKLKELGFVGTMPRTSMGASKLIQSVVGTVADTNPSDAQINRITVLIGKLGYQGEDYDYSTKAKASKVIAELQVIADDVLGVEKASPSQIEYYGRLLKICGKRLTQKQKDFAHSCNKKEISLAIEELKKLMPNTASEGQVDYLVSLHQRLMISFNADELKALTKEKATELIDKLNRDVLYMETRRYQKSLTMKTISEMSSKEVTEMLKTIKTDKKDQKAV